VPTGAWTPLAPAGRRPAWTAGLTFTQLTTSRWSGQGSSEPATINYTTDGVRPTLQSPRYEATESGSRAQVFHVTETTTFHWFWVDAAGNVEKN
jgi:hypothetical protein